MLYGVFALYPEMLLKIFLPGEEKVVAVTLEFIDWFKLAFLFSGLNMALASFFTALHGCGVRCGGSHAQFAFSGGLPVAVAATVRQCGYLRSHTVGGNVHAGRGEPDLCGQPETFCRSQGAPRPGAGGTGRKKSVGGELCGRNALEQGVAAVARQPVISYAMRPDKLVPKRTLLVMLHGCSLNRVTKK